MSDMAIFRQLAQACYSFAVSNRLRFRRDERANGRLERFLKALALS